MSSLIRALGALSLCSLAVGCTSEAPAGGTGNDLPSALTASPRSLTYRCVTPGCDTAQDVMVSASGTRRLVVKRIVLSDETRKDFTLTPETPAPFVVHDAFKLGVRYLPVGGPDPGDVKIIITYADSSSDESDPGRIAPTDLTIPIYRRMIGEPELTATPQKLVFGAVAANQTKSLKLTVGNAGFGNVALVLDAIDSDSPLVKADAVPTDPLLPGKTMDVNITYAPKVQGYTKATLTLTSTDPAVPPLSVIAVGTSFSDPVVATEPATGIDFGEVPKGTAKTRELLVMNQGGADLTVSAVAVSGTSGNVSITLPPGQTTFTLKPLESFPVTVKLASTLSGPVDEKISIISTDPKTPGLLVPVIGLVTEPQVELNPAAQLDFGLVPQTWVVEKPVIIRNKGWGGLEVKKIALVAGSSQTFGIRQLPPRMPVTLQHDETVTFAVQFRADTLATFTGTVSVETNDSAKPFVQLPVTATGATCPQACPVPKGVPDCSSGTCEIASCEADFFDLNHDLLDGCECAGQANDPGATCDSAVFLGTISDNGSQTAMSHNLPQMLDPTCVAQFGSDFATDDTCFHVDRMLADEDWIRFFGKDGNDVWFSDDYGVYVTVTSTDPTVKMCVFRHKTGSHDAQCYEEGAWCPEPAWDPGGFWRSSYGKDSSSWGPDDSSDYLVKVFRAAGAAPTCTGYSFFAKNG
jgi:hypothetical protein